MPLTVRPLHPSFVAEVTGLGMRVPLALQAAIVEASEPHRTSGMGLTPPMAELTRNVA